MSPRVRACRLHWGEINYPPYPIGDTTLSAEAARLVIANMAGGKPLETITGAPTATGTSQVYYGASGSPKFPTFMAPPMAVVNDGWRRTLLFSNDGYNPTDSASFYPGYTCFPMALTVNIAAWAVPAGYTRALPSPAAAQPPSPARFWHHWPPPHLLPCVSPFHRHHLPSSDVPHLFGPSALCCALSLLGATSERRAPHL